MPTANQYQPNDTYDLTATIASGQTTSNAIDLSGCDLCGFYMPAAFTGTTIKVQSSPTFDGTYVEVQDGAGADISLTVVPSKYIPIANLAYIAGLRFIKLVSGSSEGGTRTITIAARPV